jgi:hypothetical protein
MSITLFGTCRLDRISNHNNLNNLINYSHSTKEVIQFINFLKGELNIPNPYNKLCFRTAICQNTNINYDDSYTKAFDDTDIFIIEICSTKKFIHNDFYLHHLCVDTRWPEFNNRGPAEILNNVIIERQSDEEIENDILEIQKMLYPKKIIIVSHYNSKRNGELMNSRNNLIILLDSICKKYDISSVIDVGCGMGHALLEFMNYTKDIVGVDGSEYVQKYSPLKDIIIKIDFTIEKFISNSFL